MENETSTSSKLALLRKARNLTQEDLAVYLNVSIKTVEKIEAGEEQLDRLQISKLAQYFQVPLAYFIIEDAQAKEKQEEKKPNTIGEKILKLRKSRGLTQADVGMLLNISYQAVSKWERDESRPDFETLSKIAQFFNVSVSYFEKDGATVEPQSLIGGNMVGVCTVCGKALQKEEIGEREPKLLCKACVERRERLQKQKAEEIKQQQEKRRKEEEAKKIERATEIIRSRNTGLIWSAVITGLVVMLYIAWMVFIEEKIGITLIVAAGLMVLLYPFFAQLFWDGAVVACAKAGGAIIGTPGVIFTFDLDGFLFLIGIKFLFAIIRFLVFILTAFVCVLAAIVISPFTFFPAMARVAQGDLVD